MLMGPACFCELYLSQCLLPSQIAEPHVVPMSCIALPRRWCHQIEQTPQSSMNVCAPTHKLNRERERRYIQRSLRKVGRGTSERGSEDGARDSEGGT